MKMIASMDSCFYLTKFYNTHCTGSHCTNNSQFSHITIMLYICDLIFQKVI